MSSAADILRGRMDAYEDLIGRFVDSASTRGEFCNPRAVVRMTDQLTDPKAGESAHGPCAGDGEP